MTGTLNVSAPNIAQLELLRDGDQQGSQALLKFTLTSGRTVFAMGIGAGWENPTGPTWVYVVEDDGWTMVDAGDMQAFPKVEAAVRDVGLSLKDVKRLIVTHGHGDHEGAAFEVVAASGCELWAHEVAGPLRQVEVSDMASTLAGMPSEMRQALTEMRQDQSTRRQGPRQWQEHSETRKRLVTTHPIWEGRRCGAITCWQTPGHTPDELTMWLEGVLFTGDHILPEITPHPSVKTTYTPEVQQLLPAAYRDASQQTGLRVFLRSLARVALLEDTATILPAHRLLNRGKLNLVTARRATEIIEHHVERMGRITDLVGSSEMALLDLTPKMFRRPLDSSNFFMGLTETLAHLEFMVDSGDMRFTDHTKVVWNGTERYRQAVRETVAEVHSFD
ncbi:MAG: MBL fold metallo-hydrolase [Dehalococcoidia bacterium]|nr:MBL fold metallo-hydrolase [Dehalococcoidia bacterium]